jgi:hypothetical protein
LRFYERGGGNPGDAVAPTITSQPQSMTVTASQQASFSVTATGTAPLKYAWTSNNMAVATNSNTYTIAQTTLPLRTEPRYRLPSNAAGSMASSIATLTVNSLGVAPTITVQPVSLTVNGGQSAMFSVTATGTAPLTYAWTQNGAAVGIELHTPPG